MNTQDPTAELSIHEAAANGDLDKVQWLIEQGISVNARDNTYIDSSVLHYAAQYGQLKMVELLLAQGAMLDIKNNSGHTPLTAAIAGGHSDITQFLLNKGADPNIISFFGNHLHLAASKGLSTIIQQLLKYKVDPNWQAKIGKKTPLHVAVYSYQPAAILCLYPCTHTQLTDEFHRTPLERAITSLADALENQCNIDAIRSCLYAFLLAGADITEEWVKQQVEERRFSLVMTTIQKAIDDTKAMETRLSGFDKSIILHLLVQSPQTREAALLAVKDHLEALGYSNKPGISLSLEASIEANVEFITFQRDFTQTHLNKHPEYKKTTLSDLPVELREIIAQNLLLPPSSASQTTPSTDQHEDAYRSPSLR